MPINEKRSFFYSKKQADYSLEQGYQRTYCRLDDGTVREFTENRALGTKPTGNWDDYEDLGDGVMDHIENEGEEVSGMCPICGQSMDDCRPFGSAHVVLPNHFTGEGQYCTSSGSIGQRNHTEV